MAPLKVESPSMKTEKRTLYFTMVQHPVTGWTRAGRTYSSKEAAKEWLPFVRGTWRYLRVKVAQCTVVLIDGQLTDKSRQILSTKFNLDA
jgi:hypothetical protein